MADEGLVAVISNHSAKETIERLIAALKVRNLTVFARIDHAAGAAAAGFALHPTEVVIFGNAKGGTALMQDQQTSGIDLPLKVLVWEDDGGTTHLAYNDPQWIAVRHGLGAASAPAVKALAAALSTIAQEVTA